MALGQSAVSEAVTMLLTAAETASADGQFAPKVMCLQTAVQFGERSCGPRLLELEAIVERPRAAIAAHYAEALRAADGDELASVSEDFERMGDLVAGTDIAADAPLARPSSGCR
ncbi:MAG: response regulator containing a CheY-like receiver domain and an DNA-binding domain [Mycobacterium sp.]|nr:response regulator containing a CheY-like receiver domain and an DNA-binding domain [Mycobacterium sp.]